jgi:hypothetical protein
MPGVTEQPKQFRYGIKLEKSDPSANYRAAEEGSTSACANCRFFDRWELNCNIVEGLIQPEFTCDMFRADLWANAYSEDGYELAQLAGKQVRLFFEQSFMEAPEWIPYLPKPSTFKHPLYGPISITTERNENFVTNFNAGVYQDQIPVDAEHQTKLSGAMGWIKEMRINDDGSVDARVEWTERGKKLLEDDRFKYISPEFYEEWENPADGTVYQDIAIGCALTTRPFFKEDSLRPLVASEAGVFDFSSATQHNHEIVVHFAQLEFIESDAGGTMSEQVETTTDDIPDTPEVPEAPVVPAAEQGFTEEIKSIIASERAAREIAERTSQQLAERLTRLEDERMTQRFTNIVLGRDGSGDGARWVGDVEGHVNHLKKLAKAFGEDSEEVKYFVTTQQQHAEAIRNTPGFTPIGSSEIPTAGQSAADVADTRAKAKMREASERGETLEYGKALEMVFNEDARLFSEHQRESTIGRR